MAGYFKNGSQEVTETVLDLESWLTTDTWHTEQIVQIKPLYYSGMDKRTINGLLVESVGYEKKESIKRRVSVHMCVIKSLDAPGDGVCQLLSIHDNMYTFYGAIFTKSFWKDPIARLSLFSLKDNSLLTYFWNVSISFTEDGKIDTFEKPVLEYTKPSIPADITR